MAKHKGIQLIKAAESCPRITVKSGKGDHVKCYGRNDRGEFTATVIPVNLKGDGTECKLLKWLAGFGVFVVFVVALAILV